MLTNGKTYQFNNLAADMSGITLNALLDPVGLHKVRVEILDSERLADISEGRLHRFVYTSLPRGFLTQIRFEVNGCWTWTGLTGGGYGLISFKLPNGKQETIPAHRFVWLCVVGPIRWGYEVHHECRNRLCVNVDHLNPVSTERHQSFHSNYPEVKQ